MKKRTKRICSALLVVVLCIAGLPWAAVRGEFEVPQAETETAVLPTEIEENAVQAEAVDNNNALQPENAEDAAQEENGGVLSVGETAADTAEPHDAADADYVEVYEQTETVTEQEEKSNSDNASDTETEETAGTEAEETAEAKTDEVATAETDGTAVTETDETTAADATSETATAESGEVTETQQEERTEWLPAKELEMETEDGTGVTIAFGDNVFPRGTIVRLDDIPRDEAMENLSGAVDGIVVDAVGVDISFHDEMGEEVQPAGDVNVSLILKTPLLDGDEQTVVHIGHDGTATELSSSDVKEATVDGAEFVASSFSGYDIASVNKISDPVYYSASWLESNYKNTTDHSAKTVTLKEYIGSDKDTIVPSGIDINGQKYNTVLSVANATRGIWTNTDVISLSFAPGVTFAGNDLQNFFGGMSKLETLDLSNINTSNVKKMNNMFNNCYSLDKLILDDGFNTGNVDDMSGMFANCRNLTTLDLSKFDTRNVASMRFMFDGCAGLTALDISKFDTSNVKDMGWMFENCRGLATLAISNFDTSSVTDMSYMFKGCEGLTGLDAISGFDTSKVTTMAGMFQDCSKLGNLDLNNFKTYDETTNKGVTDMSNMFSGCANLTSLNVSSFDTSDVKNMSGMFQGCSGLKSKDVSEQSKFDVSKFKTGNVTNMSNMFSGCNSLTSLDVSKFNTGNVTDMAGMFYNCSKLKNKDDAGEELFDVSGFGTSKVTDMSGMFGGCASLTSLNVSQFSTGSVTDMSNMFSGCSNLASLAVSNFNTKSVVDMSSMFSGCKELTKLDVKNFDTSNVGETKNVDGVLKTGSMSSMFSGCSKLTELEWDNGNFNTSKVPNMSEMFKNCSSLTSLDVSGIETTNVTNMSGMFEGCSGLTELKLFNTDTTKVTNIASMFVGCNKLETLDLSKFDLKNLTEGGKIFPEVELKQIESPKNLDKDKEIPLPKVKYYNATNDMKDDDSNTSYYKNLPTTNDIGANISITLKPLTKPVKEIKLEVEMSDSKETVQEAGIFLDKSSSTNNIATLIATVSPVSAVDTSVTWKSSTPGIVSISDGSHDAKKDNVWEKKVVATQTGTTTITVTTNGKDENGQQIFATCIVTVGASVKDVTVNPTTLTLYKDSKSGGEETKYSTFSLTAQVIPEDAIVQGVTWESSDPSVATVDENGKVTAVKQGTATITATTIGKTEDGEYPTDTCKVIVEEYIYVDGVTLNPSTLELYTNRGTIYQSGSLRATVSPDSETNSATNKNVLWSSSDESVATVDTSGRVTAKSVGTATITVTTEGKTKEGINPTATCVVTVKAAVERVGIEIDQDYDFDDDDGKLPLYMVKDGKTKLNALITPDNANEQGVSWASDNLKVATVDENGIVTAVAAGTAHITVTAKDTSHGSKTESCTVTVVGYAVKVKDKRSNRDKEDIRVGVSAMTGDSYLVIADVNEEDSEILPLIEEDPDLSPTTYYVCDMSLMREEDDGSESAVRNFGNCLIRMPLPDEMSLTSGSLQVVSVLADSEGTLSLDKSIQCRPIVIDDKEYIQFDTTHFTEYAFLYTAPRPAAQPSSTVRTSSGGSSGSGSVYMSSRSSSGGGGGGSGSRSSSTGKKAAPKLIKVYWREDGSTTFYWQYRKKATGYRLEYSTDGKFKKNATQSAGRKKKNGTIKGLKDGQKYYVRVKAYKKDKNGKKVWSAWSHRIAVKRRQ